MSLKNLWPHKNNKSHMITPSIIQKINNKRRSLFKSNKVSSKRFKTKSKPKINNIKPIITVKMKFRLYQHKLVSQTNRLRKGKQFKIVNKQNLKIVSSNPKSRKLGKSILRGWFRLRYLKPKLISHCNSKTKVTSSLRLINTKMLSKNIQKVSES